MTRGLKLARDWILLGAESLIAAPRDCLIDAHAGFPTHADRWVALGLRLETHAAASEDRDPLEQRLCGTLGLSKAGYWLILLTAAIELYPEAAAAASILAEDERVQLLTPSTFARLMRAGLGIDFGEALREALPSSAPRRLGLVDALEVAPGRPVSQQGLRLRPEELAALLGAGEQVGVARATHVTRVQRGVELVYAPRLAQGAARLLAAKGLLGLRCESNRAGRQFALDLASVGGQAALFVSIAEHLPELADLARLRRDGTVILDMCAWPSERPFPIAFVSAAAEALPSLVVLVAHQAATGTLATLAVPAFGRAEGRRVWDQLVSETSDADWLSQRFRLGLEEARLALAEAGDAAALDGESGPPSRDRVTRAVLAQGSRRMGRAVTQLALQVKLDDLVVPVELARQIRDVVGWYLASPRVEREYRLRSAVSGPGLACLFSGQPGTGKTFAAQCIANELGLNLYRIDLSQVVSKYIGETEKALAQVFEEAEAGHGVLLFDEADALFGKRTEVKDAHDRYANVEVGYLLQRMESFSGIAILTSNLRSNIDQAFVRRLKFVLEFPVPDLERRKELWERALPAAHLRRKDLDLQPFIERFRLSGGLIHNIGLAAAHLAASTPDGLLGLEHVVQATYRELEKAGLARSAADFGPLAHMLPRRTP